VRAGEAVQAWLQRECGRVRGALKGAVRDGPWLACGPIDPGMRLQADDEVFRIGNAAGEAHPILGEGISMALQSAALLCSHLLAADRPGGMRAPGWQRELGRRYAADWQRQFGPRVQLAAAFAGAAMQPHAAALLMAGARAWPGLLTLGARWGGKVRTGSGAGPDAVPARPSTVQVPHS
jgi:flavin-dependent dehydrogenase